MDRYYSRFSTSGADGIIAGTMAGMAPAGIGAAMAGTGVMAGVAPWVGMVGLARAATGVIADVLNSMAAAAGDTMVAVMVGLDITAAVMLAATGVAMAVATIARR